MTDSSSSSNTPTNAPIFSVGEISGVLKTTVEETFGHVRVRGEISGFKRPGSGHLYFTLKDDQAVLNGICWKGSAGRLGIKPEDGMEVIATGRLTTYGARSNYQMVVERMELAGEGALLKLLEDRKRKLANEGLFDEGHKQNLPFLPGVIGVVTSPTGAVIRDILHRLKDRFPRRVLIWPVLVQGDKAAEQISAAIKGFNALDGSGPVPRPDLLIVARGGGSLEDLWAFNDEAVVRVTHCSKIPIISAVGHETDTTLIDFASDSRAPTPSAAAEMAVPVRNDLMAQVMGDGARVMNAINRLITDNHKNLDTASRGLPNLGQLLGDACQRLDDWTERFNNSLKSGMNERQQSFNYLSQLLVKPDALVQSAANRLSSESRALKQTTPIIFNERSSNLSRLSQLLESYSYERVLDRGFSLVTDASQKPITSVAELSFGDEVSVRLKDGKVDMIVTGSDTPKPTPKKGPPKLLDIRQRSLL
jgi:exodeoxyribonuclease VII large subunit